MDATYNCAVAIIFFITCNINVAICSTIETNLGGNVYLTCEHDFPPESIFSLGWYFHDKFDENNQRKNVIDYLLGSTSCGSDTNFTGCDRVKFENNTGNVELSSLTCWEEQVYRCEANNGSGTRQFASHDVFLTAEPIEKTLNVKVGSEQFTEKECDDKKNIKTNGNPVQLSVSYAAASKPPWTLECGGEDAGYQVECTTPPGDCVADCSTNATFWASEKVTCRVKFNKLTVAEVCVPLSAVDATRAQALLVLLVAVIAAFTQDGRT